MDLILFNGIIKTMDSTLPSVEAIAIKDGIIQQVGSYKEIISLKESNTELIDLMGKLVLPGFNDSHMHLLNYGISQQLVDLDNTNCIDEVIEKVKEFITTNNIPEGKWVRGMRWNHHQFKEKRLLTKNDLDRISTEHPIYLSRVCGHVIAANSKALELAGVTAETPQLAGGYFDTDEDGNPIGVFRENAIDLVYKHIPNPSVEEIKELIEFSTVKLHKFGITSVQSDDFVVFPNSYEKVIQAYNELREEGKLQLRVYEQCNFKTVASYKEFLNNGNYFGLGDDFYRIGPLKLLSDGSLGARTAYLKEPYSDEPETVGIPVFTQNELNELVETAHNAKMPVAIHAIGDKAIEMAFTSIENAQNKYPNKSIRHSVIHCQITDEGLLDRFKEQNVIAHIQPLFVATDLHFVEERVGIDRARTSYNWKSLLDRGVNVAFGSDAPVETPNVFQGIYAAVTRRSLDGYPEEGWLPEQKLTLEQALYGYTMGSAYASNEEMVKGSITKGKLADLIVVDNIYDLDIEQIKDFEVDITIFNGQVVYRK